MVVKSSTVTDQASATTAWRQIVVLRPSAIPATYPQMTRRSFCSVDFSRMKAGVVSNNIAPPRDTISATRPQANEAATADPTATRQATFPNGSIVTNNQE